MPDANINITAKASLEVAQNSLSSAQQFAETLKQLKEAGSGTSTLNIVPKIDPAATAKAVDEVNKAGEKLDNSAQAVEAAAARRIRSTYTQAEQFLEKRKQLVTQINRGSYEGINDQQEAKSIARAQGKLGILRDINQEIQKTSGTRINRETRALIGQYNRLEDNPAQQIRSTYKGQPARIEEIDYRTQVKEISLAEQIAQRQSRLAAREIISAGAVPKYKPEEASEVSSQQLNKLVDRYYSRMRLENPSDAAEEALARIQAAMKKAPLVAPVVQPQVFGQGATSPPSAGQQRLLALGSTPQIPNQDYISPIVQKQSILSRLRTVLARTDAGSVGKELSSVYTELSTILSENTGINLRRLLNEKAADVKRLLKSERGAIGLGNNDDIAQTFQNLAQNSPLLAKAAQYAGSKGQFSSAQFSQETNTPIRASKELGRQLEGIGIIGAAPNQFSPRPLAVSTQDAAAFALSLENASKNTQKLAASSQEAAVAIDQQTVAERRTAAGLPNVAPAAGAGGRGGPPIVPPPVGGGGPPPEEPGGKLNEAYGKYSQGAVSGYVRSFGTAFQSLMNYAGAATVIYGIASSISTATRNAVQFEEEMARLQGILPGQKLSDTFKIEEGVIDTARRYGATLNDVVGIAQAFAQTGRTAAQVVSDLNRTFAATTGLGITINEAQELLIAVRSLTYEYEQQRSAIDVDVFDRIAAAQERAAASAADLTNALKTAGPVAHELRGQYVGLVDEIDLVLAATGQIVQKTGLPGTQVATSLRNTFARLGRPEVIKALQQVGGVNLATPESGGTQLRPLYEIIGELSKAYNRLKGTADLQRLLVQLAGSRQTNAIVALLDNYSKVTEDAEHAALAFGNAQSRTELVLNTTAVSLRRFGANLETVGISLLQASNAGGVFRTVVGGLNNLFGFIGKNSDTVVIKLAGLGAVILFLVRNLRLLSTAMSFAIGAKTLEQLTAVSSGFNVFGASIVSVATRIKTFLAGKALFTGLLEAIGPGGIIALTIVALGGIVFAIQKIIDLGKEVHPLAITPINGQDIQQQNIPQLLDFIDKAHKFGVSSNELFTGIDNVSKITLQSLSQLGKPIDKLTRSEIIAVLYPNLRKGVQGFAQDIDTATEGMDKQAKQAYIIQQTMELIGKAAFIQSGVIGANYNRFLQQTESIRQKVIDTVSQLSRSNVQLRPDIIGRGPSGINQSYYSQLTDALDKVDNTVGPLILDFVKAAQSVGILSDSLDELKGKTGVADVLESIGQRVQTIFGASGGGAQRTKLIEEFSRRLQGEFQTDKLKDSPIAGLFDQKGPAGTFLKTFDEVFEPAIERLGQSLQSNLGGQSILGVDRVLRNSGEGVKAILNSMHELVTETKNPFTDFIQNLYLSLKAIDANAEAARRFGLAFDEPLTRLQTLERLASESYQIPLQTSKELLEVQQQINQLRGKGIIDTVTSSGRRRGSQVPIEEAAQTAEGQQSDMRRLQDQYDRLTTRKNELIRQLESFTNDPHFQESVDNLLSIIDITSPTANNLQAVFKKIKNKEGNLQANLAEGARLFDQLLTEQREAVRNVLTRESSRETVRILGIDRINATKEIRQAAIQANLQAGLFAQSPSEALGPRAEANAGQKLLEIAAARQQYEVNLIALEGRHAEIAKTLGDSVYQADLIALQTERDRAITQAEINEGKQNELDLIKAISEDTTKYQSQLATNLTNRLSGLKDILLDVNSLIKGKSIQTIITGAGKAFYERQISQLLDGLFKPDSGIGKIIGKAGEQSPTVIAGNIHADLVYNAIVRGANYHANAIGAAEGIGGFRPGSTAPGLPPIGIPRTGPKGPGEEEGTTATGGVTSDVEQATKDYQAAQKKAEKAQLFGALGTAAGVIVGTAIAPKGKREAAQTGAELGAAAGSFLPLPPGVGQFVGGIVGSFLGGVFGKSKPQPPESIALQKIAANTGEQVTLLENTNKLLELSSTSFNVPTNFVLPKYNPSASAAPFGVTTNNASISNDVSVQVNVAGSNADPSQIGQMVAAAVSERLDSEYRAGGRYVTRTRY